MNTLSPSAAQWLGAGSGVLVALVAYVTVAQAFQQQIARSDRSRNFEMRARIERNWSIIRAILLADFVILGAVGYYAGGLIGS